MSCAKTNRLLQGRPPITRATRNQTLMTIGNPIVDDAADNEQISNDTEKEPNRPLTFLRTNLSADPTISKVLFMTLPTPKVV